jgi:hypothetical protein
MLDEEMFEHVDDRRSSAWRHSLLAAPSVDPLDQLGLDPNIDICCFLSHAGEMGRCRVPRLIIPAKRLIIGPPVDHHPSELPIACRASLVTAPRPFIVRPDERETATHEAGHCVSLVRFGLRFDTVKIWRDDAGQMHGQVTDPDNGTDLLALAVCCLAGPVARQHLLGNQKFQAGDGDDLEVAHGIMTRLGLVDGIEAGIEALKALMPFARLLVAHAFPKIQLIAGELVRRKQLSYEQVVRLIEG